FKRLSGDGEKISIQRLSLLFESSVEYSESPPLGTSCSIREIHIRSNDFTSVSHEPCHHTHAVPQQVRVERRVNIRFDHRGIHTHFLAVLDLVLLGDSNQQTVDLLDR